MSVAVSVNGHVTTWFAMECGIRQGDVLAPTIFNIYINDLVDIIKALTVEYIWEMFQYQY